MERDQERLARTHRTDKSGVFKANSGEFPVKQKFGYSQTVGVSSFVDDASSENSSKNVLANCTVFPSQQTATNLTTQKVTDPETNVSVELIESLKGVITKLESTVKSSPCCQHTCSICQSDAGSLDLKNKTEVSSSKSEICFCGRSREEKLRVVKNAVATENELAFEKIKDFVDISDKSDDVVELVKPFESFTPMSASERNGKQRNSETDVVPPVSSNTIENKVTVKAARNTKESCDEAFSFSFSDNNAVFDLKKCH